MEVLPIKSIREEDGPIIGNSLLNLAKLAQLDFPVCDGIVVIPPNFKFKTILEHFQFRSREVFEQSLHLVKGEIARIPIPKELDKILVRRKIDSKKTWSNLLNIWLNQTRSKIWREGFSPNLTEHLKAEPVFFTTKITSSGQAFFDYNQKIASIETISGKISHENTLQIDHLIKRADKKLYLPQVYSWIIDSSLKIVGVKQFTPNYEQSQNQPENINPQNDATEKWAKSSIKVFLELGEDLRIARNIDGLLIKGEKISGLDKKITQLVEAGLTFPNCPIIFRLPDQGESFGGVRGTLKLIHGGTILGKEAEAILFARHKKGLLNVSVAIPFVRSAQEFLQIKRNLAGLGISRKGSLKIWIEMGAPENILNIGDYLSAGFDGALLNLDELAAWLGGFNPEEDESIFYKKQTSALLNFLEGKIKVLHKAKIPVLALGQLSLHDDILAFLINEGVWGIVVDFSSITGISEHLHFVEERHIRSKIN